MEKCCEIHCLVCRKPLAEFEIKLSEQYPTAQGYGMCLICENKSYLVEELKVLIRKEDQKMYKLSMASQIERSREKFTFILGLTKALSIIEGGNT